MLGGVPVTCFSQMTPQTVAVCVWIPLLEPLLTRREGWHLPIFMGSNLPFPLDHLGCLFKLLEGFCLEKSIYYPLPPKKDTWRIILKIPRHPNTSWGSVFGPLKYTQNTKPEEVLGCLGWYIEFPTWKPMKQIKHSWIGKHTPFLPMDLSWVGNNAMVKPLGGSW